VIKTEPVNGVGKLHPSIFQSELDISLNGKGGVMGRVISDDQLGDRNYAANALAFTDGSSLDHSRTG